MTDWNWSTELLVRFYGRFVFVQNKKDPTHLTALAIDMARQGLAEKHDAFMTILESNVNRTARTDECVPSHRIIGTDLSPYEAARDFWKIEGCHIDIPVQGGFRWADTRVTTPIADLNALIKPQTAKMLPLDSVASAVITLHAGTGVASHLTTLKFMEYKYVLYGNHTQETNDPQTKLADMVQVSIKLPGSTKLVVTKAGDVKTVALEPKFAGHQFPVPAVVLSFSNLCTRSSAGVYDTEFAAFYDILEDPPAKTTRKIPKLATAPALVPTAGIALPPEPYSWPFGDCFLGASIEV
jgi:hypothetical protein